MAGKRGQYAVQGGREAESTGTARATRDAPRKDVADLLLVHGQLLLVQRNDAAVQRHDFPAAGSHGRAVSERREFAARNLGGRGMDELAATAIKVFGGLAVVLAALFIVLSVVARPAAVEDAQRPKAE